MKDPLQFCRHRRLSELLLDIGDPLKGFRLKIPSVGLLDIEDHLKYFRRKKSTGEHEKPSEGLRDIKKPFDEFLNTEDPLKAL